jgi:uncharacterized protein YbjT (DUF2867 family)
MILVLGATGTVGAETIKSLKARGISVTAASRDAQKAEAQLGVPAVAWDFEQPELCEQIMQGVETLFLLSPPGIDKELEYGLQTVKAAKAAGIRKVVKLSAIGVQDQPDSPHRQVELAVEKAGFQWTFLRPSFFMQNCNESFLPSVKHDGGLFLPAGEGRTGFVDARDVGAVAAETLTTDTFVGQGLTLTGSEALTYSEVASILGQSIGKTVRYVDIPPEQFKKALLAAGVPERYCDVMNMLYGFVKAGYLATVTDDLTKILKRPPITFAQYARDYAQAFA